jgi:hypothetical protein
MHECVFYAPLVETLSYMRIYCMNIALQNRQSGPEVESRAMLVQRARFPSLWGTMREMSAKGHNSGGLAAMAEVEYASTHSWGIGTLARYRTVEQIGEGTYG